MLDRPNRHSISDVLSLCGKMALGIRFHPLEPGRRPTLGEAPGATTRDTGRHSWLHCQKIPPVTQPPQHVLQDRGGQAPL